MGLFDAIRKMLPKVKVAKEYHHAPSPQFPGQVDLIAFLVERIPTDGWASLEATNHSGETAFIQVLTDCVNTCQETVDLKSIVQAVGLNDLAETIVPAKGVATLHQIPNATPQELAEVAHAIFVHHFQFATTYRMEGWLED